MTLQKVMNQILRESGGEMKVGDMHKELIRRGWMKAPETQPQKGDQ